MALCHRNVAPVCRNGGSQKLDRWIKLGWNTQLFEEIWGEIDHTINYPYPTEIVACKEQLRVLAKLVSTGTRLADSIFRTYNDADKKE